MCAFAVGRSISFFRFFVSAVAEASRPFDFLVSGGAVDVLCLRHRAAVRPLQNLHPLNFHPYTLRRMNIFDQKMPLEVTF